MFCFNKKNKLMSILLLFVMVFQIGFTSSSFALERTNYNGIMNYEYREYTLADLVNCEICEEMSKEEILVFLDFLNNPKVREANNRLIKSLNKSDRVSRMQWYQTPDLIGGLIKGVYEEIGATVEGFLSLLDPSTYEAMMDFCIAISTGEIGLDELQEIIWSDLECVVYVIDNTFYVFDPDSSVSGEEVNEYGKNLAKTIIKILDAKSMLKELPESIGKFNSFLDDFGGITGNVVNHKRPKIDIDLDDVADIVDENEFDMNLQLFANNSDSIVRSLADIPTIKSGCFRDWFDSLTPDELDTIWETKGFRKKIERQLRNPGGMHEWHLVSRTPKFKRWGVTADEIIDFRTAIEDVKFINPDGHHGGFGSTTAHNELLGIIDTCNSYDRFKIRLNVWADYRLLGGSESLPDGLRLD